jgi:hypothetical protein
MAPSNDLGAKNTPSWAEIEATASYYYAADYGNRSESLFFCRGMRCNCRNRIGFSKRAFVERIALHRPVRPEWALLPHGARFSV